MSTIQFTNIAKENLTADVHSLSGQVIAINRSNQTHLHASGGGAYASVNQHGHASARVSPVNITSSTSVHDDVYILTESGEEVFVQLVNWENAGIRQGHHIQLIWLNITSYNPPKPTPYVIVNNRSLNKVLYNYEALGNVVRPTKFSKVFTAYGQILSTTAKIVCCVLIFIGIITIILAPLVVVVAKTCSHYLNKKLPDVAQREVTPKLQSFLLPALPKQPIANV